MNLGAQRRKIESRLIALSGGQTLCIDNLEEKTAENYAAYFRKKGHIAVTGQICDGSTQDATVKYYSLHLIKGVK